MPNMRRAGDVAMPLEDDEITSVRTLDACLLLTTFCLTSISDLHHPTHTALRVLTPLIEVSFASLLCVWFIRRSGRLGESLWLVSAVLPGFVYCAVYALQGHSLYFSNNYISALALQNSDSKSLAESLILRLRQRISSPWGSSTNATASE